MRPDVERWFRSHTSQAGDWALADLVAARSATGTTVSVVLPALDEQDTIGAIVSRIVAELGSGASSAHRLVDELVVLDSGSSDDTAAVAAAAGARVVHRDEVLPGIPAVPGKGEAMWRSLAATSGDVLVFIDADLRSFTAGYVTGLLGPLLADPQTALVKAVYERPLINGDTVVRAGGGRVTELVARPLINLHWPELAAVVQPLAGEYAARRSLLETLPFPCGYGVELALLVDTVESVGLQAIAQVDLGVRRHRHHDEQRLGRMAADIMATAYSRVAAPSGALGTTLAQFQRRGEGFELLEHEIVRLERPPMVTVPEYLLGHARPQSVACR